MLADSKYARDVAQHPDGDRFLLRFLRASMKSKHHKRIFQTKAAFKRAVETLEFRREQGFNRSFSEVPVPTTYHIYRELSPQYCWVDKKRETLVYIERFGFLGSYLQRHHLTDEEWISSLAYNNEKTAHWLRTFFDEERLGIDVIVDLRGLTTGLVSRYSLLKLINGVISKHFPESLNKITIINAPFVFASLFKVIRTFMDPDTISKITIHYSLPKTFLRENFDTDFLPVEFGGDCEYVMPIPRDAPAKYHSLDEGEPLSEPAGTTKTLQTPTPQEKKPQSEPLPRISYNHGDKKKTFEGEEGEEETWLEFFQKQFGEILEGIQRAIRATRT